MSANNLKAVSVSADELRVGNYMVLFGGKDIVGEFFTQKTDFKSAYTDLGVMYVDFEHGADPDRMGNNANNVLGIVDWKSAKIDDKGIYVERILNRRAEYMKFVEELIDAGVMGSSSAAVPGATTKKSGGEIVEWPLMRDSLTVTPMEPRMAMGNVLAAAKSLLQIFPHAKSLAGICGEKIDEITSNTIETITDFKSAERYLRESGSLSRTQATALVARLKSLCQRDAADEEKANQVIQALTRRTELMKL